MVSGLISESSGFISSSTSFWFLFLFRTSRIYLFFFFFFHFGIGLNHLSNPEIHFPIQKFKRTTFLYSNSVRFVSGRVSLFLRFFFSPNLLLFFLKLWFAYSPVLTSFYFILFGLKKQISGRHIQCSLLAHSQIKCAASSGRNYQELGFDEGESRSEPYWLILIKEAYW